MGMQLSNEVANMTMREYADSLKVHVIVDEDIEGFKWWWINGQYYVNFRHLKEFRAMVDRCVEYYDQD